MSRIRFLVLALVVGLVMAFPSAALGQPLQDHLSRLMVTIDGGNAPDDTKVTAMIDGADVATAMAMTMEASPSSRCGHIFGAVLRA